MLFAPDSMIQARRELIQQVQAGELTEEQAFQKALDWDPFDIVALGVLADARFKAGDLAGTVEYCWRAVQADPCRYEPWFKLHACLKGESGAFLDGILELATLKTLRSPGGVADFEESFKNTAEATHFPGGEEALEIMAAQLGEKRRDEPAEVSERLKPYRLVDEVLDAVGGLDEELVDEIVTDGARCGPLLAGVLRAMATGSLPADDPSPAVAALALQGEIGDPAVLPELIECYSVDSDAIRDAAHWAVSRTAARQPEESFAAVRKLAPAADADADARGVLALVVGQIPHEPGKQEFLLGLLDGLEALPKSSRRDLFLVVAHVLLVSQGDAGEQLVWSLFDRYAAHLPKRTRADLRQDTQAAQALREIWQSERDDDSRRTVYDFCSGANEDEEDDDEEDEDYQPEARRRAVNTGRNDPCWCGSGKKYKKCHLEADQQQPSPQERPAAAEDSGKNTVEARLRRRLIEFPSEALRKPDMEEALRTFVGSGLSSGGDDDSLELETVDWLIHDYISPRWGSSVIEEFIRRNPGSLSARERQILDAWSRSRYSLFEVQDVEPDAGVLVTDLLAGGGFFVHDVSTARRAVRWDCYLARVEELDGGHEFTAIVLTLPRHVAGPLKEWAVEARERSRLNWDDFLRANSHRLRQEASRLLAQAAEPQRVVSFEGDELVFSNARYEILDEDALRRALDSSPALDHHADTGNYGWLDEPDGSSGRRVLGHLRMAGRRLTLECATRQRLERGKKLLLDLAGPALRHLGDDFTGWKAAMRNRRPPADAPAPPRLPAEAERRIVEQLLAEHYARWPDKPLPALDGKTPREAVATSGGRAQVEDLLKMIENGEERNRRDGLAWYDVSTLKSELGVEF